MTIINLKNKNDKKNHTISFFSKIGAALIYPISILPFAGLILGFSIIFGSFGLNYLSIIIEKISLSIFNIFPILVIFSIAFKFSKTESGFAIFNTTFSLFFFIVVHSFLIQNNLNIKTRWDDYFVIESNNFSYYIFSIANAIFLGIFYSTVFNWQYYKNNNYLSTLFVMVLFTIPFAIFYTYFWVFILIIIFFVGWIISFLPFGIDAFFYGFLNRLLLLFGLHSIMMSFFLYSPIGGVLIENGKIIAQGDTMIWVTTQNLNIPLQVVRDGSKIGKFVFNNNNYEITKNINPGQYQQGFFPIMIFAFPICGYVMYKKIKTKNKDYAKIVLLTSFIPMLTGITEPFEYLFIFEFPVLYLLHSLFVGISFMLMDILNISIWLSSGWIIDVFIFGVFLQLFTDNITNYYYIFVVGLVLMPLYYFSFNRFFIYN